MEYLEEHFTTPYRLLTQLSQVWCVEYYQNVMVVVGAAVTKFEYIQVSLLFSSIYDYSTLSRHARTRLRQRNSRLVCLAKAFLRPAAAAAW